MEEIIELKGITEHYFVIKCQYLCDRLSPEGVDLVLDCLSGEDTNKGINITKPLGRYVLFGTASVITGETKSFFSFAKSVSSERELTRAVAIDRTADDRECSNTCC